ncbi:hypothetical protein EBB07_25350 [Paenibacillaceae bacterium]|nr:hypothetical protein EBB07_25350 [Paenibacillaceae bacterium]
MEKHTEIERRMKYTYPDGNEVVFVMFLFYAKADLKGKLAEDGRTVIFRDPTRESLQLEFKSLDEIDIDAISSVQKPVFIDMKEEAAATLRT